MTEKEIEKLRQYHRQTLMILSDLNEIEVTVSRLRNELLKMDKIMVNHIDKGVTKDGNGT